MYQSLWNRLKLKYFIAKRGLGFSADFTELVYKIYLNHSKVIHVRDGYPVYSLSTPALYSKPAANFIARSLYRSIQNKNLPNLMSFAVTDICNVTCEHCSFYEAIDDSSREILSLAESQKLISHAQELGVSIINIVGGEPLMRQDLTHIIASINKDLSTAILFTNGWFLEEKVIELKKAGLDGVYVSFDSSDEDEHDRLRQRKSLYRRALSGLKKAKEIGLTIGVSCCMTPEKYASGEFVKIVEWSREIGAHEVLVFDAMPVGRIKKRLDLVDDRDWIEEMILESEKFNSNPDYPGVLIHAYALSHRSVGCSCGTSYFYATPYGDISSCDFNAKYFGNVRDEPLYKIWDRLSNTSGYCQAKWGGCKVKDSEFINSMNFESCTTCHDKATTICEIKNISNLTRINSNTN